MYVNRTTKCNRRGTVQGDDMTRFQRRVFSTATHLIISGSLRRGPRFSLKTAKLGWFLVLLGIAASGFGFWSLTHAILPSPDQAITMQDDSAGETLAPLV